LAFAIGKIVAAGKGLVYTTLDGLTVSQLDKYGFVSIGFDNQTKRPSLLQIIYVNAKDILTISRKLRFGPDGRSEFNMLSVPI